VTDFQVGEIADITIKGVRIAAVPIAGQNDTFAIIDEHGNRYRMPPQAAVERVAPADWPPQPGDLWRDQGGTLWFAVESETRAVVLTCNGKNRRPAVAISDLYSPLTLVHRDGGDQR
jgi:hypothetical protein